MNKSLFALVCSGGGAVGAYQVGAIKYIHEHFSPSGQSPFQLFAGMSCGSLNTTFLACHSSTAKQASKSLEQLWLNFHVPAYSDRLLRASFRAFARDIVANFKRFRGNWGLLDPQPTQDIVKQGISRNSLEENFRSGNTKGVAVAATEVISGYPVWFVEGENAISWERFHSLGKITKVGPEHVIASCSIPFFFPMAKIGDHYFVDGNINLNRPFSAAISMGATKILSIRTSTPAEHALATYRKGFRPSWKTQIRLLFKSFTRDFSQSETEQLEVLNRFAEELPKKPLKLHSKNFTRNGVFTRGFQPCQYQTVTVETLEPSIDPELLCDQLMETKGRRFRGRQHGFMFHRNYINHLISFGYEDAKRKHDALARFFAD